MKVGKKIGSKCRRGQPWVGRLTRKKNTHTRVEELLADEVSGDVHGVSSYYLDPFVPGDVRAVGELGTSAVFGARGGRMNGGGASGECGEGMGGRRDGI